MAAQGFVVLAHPFREIAFQQILEIGVVGDGAVGHVALQLQLAVGQQHRFLGPGQALSGLAAFGDDDGVGQALHRAVELAARFEVGHVAGVGFKLAN